MFGSVYFGQSYFGGSQNVVAVVVRNLFILLDFTLAPISLAFEQADISLVYQHGSISSEFEQVDAGIIYQLLSLALELQ
jgi:hypothetical protein